jgi:cell division protein FtsQ
VRSRRRPPASAEDRTRRRFARRQWRRRWLAWRYLVVLIALVLVAGFGIWAAYFSSWLSVQGVDIAGVSGSTTLTKGQVRRAAAVPTGGPLLRADLDAVRRRVAALAPVRSVDVTREWPDQVRVVVTERVPVAVIEIGGQLHALDADGVVFSSYHSAPAGLPRVSTPAGTDAAALRQATEVVTALPRDLAERVDHVEVTSVDEISLALAAGQTVQWGSAADSATKAEVLAALLKAQPHATAYDVSVPGQPVTSG